ncbi:hypothetical protein RX398_07725 [Collinsella aerofaciens]|nr:hypothetical protein [Collinsella aerofaciens]
MKILVLDLRLHSFDSHRILEQNARTQIHRPVLDDNNIQSTKKDAKQTMSSNLLILAASMDRVPNVGVRGCFPGRRKQEAVIA